MIKLRQEPPPPPRSLFLPVLSEDGSLSRVISQAAFPQICRAAGEVIVLHISVSSNVR